VKKILIISDFFAPDNEIAAVRLTKIGKYLALSGYTVDVLKRGKSGRKEDPLLKKDLQYFNKIYENCNNGIFVFLYKKFLGGNNQNNTGNTVKTKWRLIKKITIVKLIKDALFCFIIDIININYYFTAISRKDIQFKDYDFVLSSYGPKSSHLLGTFIKKKYRNIIWVADFRDSMNSIVTSKIFRAYNKFHEKKILKNADIITVVSSGCFSLSSSKIHLIPNGFDEDDYPKQKEKQSLIVTDKYIYSYTGDMYGGKRDMRIFFQILKELMDKQIIKRENIEIRYLGKTANYFFEQASDFSLKDIIKNYGFVSREESIIVQKESNALLLASWNDNHNQGIITGKIYEYLMAERPILCFISGNIANSELKKMIKEFDAGYCYEEANAMADYCIMKNYIKELIINWQEGKKIKFSPNVTYIGQYNYRISCKKLIKLIEAI
jgi:hypothetical protein